MDAVVKPWPKNPAPEVLSEHVRALCDDSIRAAGRDERKTVLDRDVPRPRR